MVGSRPPGGCVRYWALGGVKRLFCRTRSLAGYRRRCRPAVGYLPARDSCVETRAYFFLLWNEQNGKFLFFSTKDTKSTKFSLFSCFSCLSWRKIIPQQFEIGSIGTTFASFAVKKELTRCTKNTANGKFNVAPPNFGPVLQRPNQVIKFGIDIRFGLNGSGDLFPNMFTKLFA